MRCQNPIFSPASDFGFGSGMATDLIPKSEKLHIGLRVRFRKEKPHFVAASKSGFFSLPLICVLA